MALHRGSWPWVVVLIVAALVGGTIGNLPFLIHVAYLLCTLATVALLYAWLARRALVIDYRSGAARTVVGERLLELYEARSTTLLPLLVGGLGAHPGLAASYQRWALSLRPRGRQEWTTVTMATARGRFRLGPALLWTADPFGLFYLSRPCDTGTEVIVHPRPRIVPDFALAAAHAGDLLPARRSWARMPVSGAVRPFALGDPSTRIHWLSTARHGLLMVKDSDRSVGQRLWVSLDLCSSRHTGSGEESTVEYAVEAAAYVIELAFKAGLDVGLIVAGRRTLVAEPARGRDQYEHLFDLLAVARAGEGVPLAAAVDDCRAARPSDALVLLTPEATPDLVDLCARLRRLGCGVALIWLDAASFGGVATSIDALDAERVAVYPLRRVGR